MESRGKRSKPRYGEAAWVGKQISVQPFFELLLECGIGYSPRQRSRGGDKYNLVISCGPSCENAMILPRFKIKKSLNEGGGSLNIAIRKRYQGKTLSHLSRGGTRGGYNQPLEPLGAIDRALL